MRSVRMIKEARRRLLERRSLRWVFALAAAVPIGAILYAGRWSLDTSNGPLDPSLREPLLHYVSPKPANNDAAHEPERVAAPELDGGVAWLNSSGPIRLRDLRGKIVLLDFWTFCCI